MLNILLMIVLSFLAVSMYIAYQKEKAEIKGLKSALTSICFFSLAILICSHIGFSSAVC